MGGWQEHQSTQLIPVNLLVVFQQQPAQDAFLRICSKFHSMLFELAFQIFFAGIRPDNTLRQTLALFSFHRVSKLLSLSWPIIDATLT